LQIFGSGEQTRTLTHVQDIADGIVAAMSSPAGLNEDFNVSASRELSVAEIARIVWEACGQDPAAFELEHLPSFPVDVQRRWPSVEKARSMLGWQARIEPEEGIAATVRWLRERNALLESVRPKRATRPRRRRTEHARQARASGRRRAHRRRGIGCPRCRSWPCRGSSPRSPPSSPA